MIAKPPTKPIKTHQKQLKFNLVSFFCFDFPPGLYFRSTFTLVFPYRTLLDVGPEIFLRWQTSNPVEPSRTQGDGEGGFLMKCRNGNGRGTQILEIVGKVTMGTSRQAFPWIPIDVHLPHGPIHPIPQWPVAVTWHQMEVQHRRLNFAALPCASPPSQASVLLLGPVSRRPKQTPAPDQPGPANRPGSTQSPAP